MAVNIQKTDLLLRMPLDGSTSFTSPTIDCKAYTDMWMAIEYGADASASDDLKIRFSVYPGGPLIALADTTTNGAYNPGSMGLNSASGAAAATTLTASSIVINVAGAQHWYHMSNGPPPYVNLVYTRAGGSRQFLWTIFGRAG